MNRLTTALAIVAVLGAPPALAQPAKPDSSYVVDVRAVDYAFDMPTEIPSGWVTFRFENIGQETHMASIFRRHESMSRGEFIEAIRANRPPVPHLATGGPGVHAAGYASESTVYLEPGDYFLECAIKRPDGTKHYELGMIRYFRVTDSPSGASRPAADRTLRLTPYEFVGARQMRPGRQVIAAIHAGSDQFDAHLVALGGGSTVAKAVDYLETFRDPTAVAFRGGAQPAPQGDTTYLSFDLAPGEYAWVSHYGTWGMVEPFAVREEGSLAEAQTGGDEAQTPPRAPVQHGVELTVGDSALHAPDGLSAGRTTLTLRNEGDALCVAELYRMQPGEAEAGVIEFMRTTWAKRAEGPETLTPLIEQFRSRLFEGYKVRFDATPPGQEATVSVELTPGAYTAACFQPARAARGEMPLKESMVRTFRVES